jgi:mono/diheme cytochrome c family protein
MLKGIIVGAVSTLAAIAVGAYLFISLGLMPANADGKPPWLEKWAAKKSLKVTIEREMPKGDNSAALSDENMLTGIKLYAANCAVCHGAADGKASNIASGLYQHAPQLGKHGVEDDPDGENYWKIYHGIRMTGMPSYSKTLSEQDIWKIVLFLKNMDKLSPAADKAWKAVPSAAPAV